MSLWTATRLPSALLAILALPLAGCYEYTDILGDVKTGTLPSTTKPIGQAFDAAFPGGAWTADMTGMGEMYAHFRSTSTVEALEAAGVPEIDHACIDGVAHPCRIPVSFDFVLSPGPIHSISLAEVKAPAPMKSGEQLTALLAFVYR